jgi:hypothetical protein
MLNAEDRATSSNRDVEQASFRRSRSVVHSDDIPCAAECARPAVARCASCRNDGNRTADKRYRAAVEVTECLSSATTPLQIGEAHSPLTTGRLAIVPNCFSCIHTISACRAGDSDLSAMRLRGWFIVVPLSPSLLHSSIVYLLTVDCVCPNAFRISVRARSLRLFNDSVGRDDSSEDSEIVIVRHFQRLEILVFRHQANVPFLDGKPFDG